MSKVLLVFGLMMALLFVPFSSGMLWQSTETHTLFSTGSWNKLNIQMKNPKIATGLDSWAVWNSNSIYVIHGGAHWINSSNIEKVWVGGEYVGILYSNGTTGILSLSSSTLTKVPVKDVQRMILTDFGAVIFNSTISVLDIKSGKLYDFSGFSFMSSDIAHHEFIFSKGNVLFGYQGDKEMWNISFDSKIKNAYGFKDGYYVLAEKTLYFVNNEHKLEGRYKTNAEEFVMLNNEPLLLNEITDDEGEKQWVINVLSNENGSIEEKEQYMTYISPQKLVSLGPFVSFYDRKSIHIISENYHIHANNTFSNVEFSSNTIVAMNSTGVYYLTSEEIKNTLKYIGDDFDMDWIPDSKDSDADNDGMPNWWEEKYGLNPLNPADRNIDVDHDGLTNYQEYLNGTNPLKWDTDGDGLSDGYEVAHGMNPLVPNNAMKYNIQLVNYTIIAFFAIFAILGLKKEEK